MIRLSRPMMAAARPRSQWARSATVSITGRKDSYHPGLLWSGVAAEYVALGTSLLGTAKLSVA